MDGELELLAENGLELIAVELEHEASRSIFAKMLLPPPVQGRSHGGAGRSKGRRLAAA